MTKGRHWAFGIALLYLDMIIVAVAAYFTHHVFTYGVASWFGGVLFVLGVQAWGAGRRHSLAVDADVLLDQDVEEIA